MPLRLCARLDGLPLAIELAASCLSMLPVEGIARRLDDRFRLLTGGVRTALPRQQTLRATVDWSYSLLTVPEQALLRRLSVFAGSWTLDAAEAVCLDADVLPQTDIVTHLRSLINKSLVTYDETALVPRYRMLETIRQYAGEKLIAGAEQTELRSGHASYFAGMAQEAWLQLAGKEQLVWLLRLGADLDNIRTALGWTMHAGEMEHGLRLASSIWRFWQRTGQGGEGRRWLIELLHRAEQESVSVSTRAQALYALACLASTLNDLEGARESYTRSLELYRHIQDARGMAEALNGLGVVLMYQGSYDEAQSNFEASIQQSSGIADGSGAHASVTNLASIVRYHGDYRTALELYERALEMQRRIGHTEAVLNTLNNLAQVYGTLGDYESAGTMVAEGLARARESGLMNILENVLATKAVQELETGRLSDAEATLEECLQLSRSLESRGFEYLALTNLSELMLLRGEPERATAFAEQSLAAWRQSSDRRGQAFALLALGEAARMQQKYEEAQSLLDECLDIRRDLADPVGMVDALEAHARLRKDLCDLPGAIVLLSAAAALRDRLGTPLPPVWQERHEQDITELRERIGSIEYASRWEEGRQMALTYLHETASGLEA